MEFRVQVVEPGGGSCRGYLGSHIAVVFQEDVLQVFQHVSWDAWALPVDSYKRVRDGTMVCQPFPDELTSYRLDFVI